MDASNSPSTSTAPMVVQPVCQSNAPQLLRQVCPNTFQCACAKCTTATSTFWTYYHREFYYPFAHRLSVSKYTMQDILPLLEAHARSPADDGKSVLLYFLASNFCRNTVLNVVSLGANVDLMTMIMQDYATKHVEQMGYNRWHVGN